MRPGPSIPKHVNENMSRQQDQDQRLGRKVVCMVYRGRLPSGMLSPGCVPSISRDKRFGIYVCPAAAYRERGQVGTVDPKDVSRPREEAAWAEENVRLIKVDNEGLSPQEIEKDYYVVTDYPFWNATTGKLVKKPARRESEASVPDGVTADDMARQKMIDKQIETIEKVRMARARYGTAKGPKPGIPYGGREEQFPAPGDRWI